MVFMPNRLICDNLEQTADAFSLPTIKETPKGPFMACQTPNNLLWRVVKQIYTDSCTVIWQHHFEMGRAWFFPFSVNIQETSSNPPFQKGSSITATDSPSPSPGTLSRSLDPKWKVLKKGLSNKVTSTFYRAERQ